MGVRCLYTPIRAGKRLGGLSQAGTTMHGFLLFLGAGIVLAGMSLALSNLRNVALRKRILTTAMSPISQAMGGPVEIKGNIVPSDKGLVEAPLSGRQTVWTRVTVEQYRSGSDSNPGASSIVLNEVNGRPLLRRRQLWRSGPHYSR
jgi:hypothetical protein